MLILSSALVDEMVAHAREQHPIEACGIIAGPAGTDRPTRLIRMRNTSGSTQAFAFDIADQIALYRQMDERGEDPIVIYHSHTATAPTPSGTDTQFALDPETRRPLHPGAHYVIVSTADPGKPKIRSWQLTGDQPLNPWAAEPIATDAEIGESTSALAAIFPAPDQPHSSA